MDGSRPETAGMLSINQGGMQYSDGLRSVHQASLPTGASAMRIFNDSPENL